MSVRSFRTLVSSVGASLLLLACVSSASAATVAVQSLKPPFQASNSTVTKTPDGVHFGTYADGGLIGGTLRYTGFNGRKLSEVTDFGYTFTYRERNPGTTGAAPYSRIFLDENPAVDSDGNGNPADDIDHDIVLDTSTCGANVQPQSTDLTFNMNTHTVRLDDDACGTNPERSFADVKAERGNDTIIGMLVSQGNSTGNDVSALVRSISVNGTTFAFDVAPADGTNGTNGTNGATGATGPAGPAGPTGPAATTQSRSASSVCSGAKLRTIHAPSRSSSRFVGARATLRGKALKVSGRAITVNLRSKSQGTYNVKITSRYRKDGKVKTVKTTRTLSVACS